MEYTELENQGIIDEVNNFPAQEKIVEIDLNLALGNNVINSYNYDEALKKIGSFEGREELRQERQPAELHYEKKKAENAAKEIKSIVGSIGKEFEKSVKRETEKIKGEKLVLPTLSLQDQISELEKISEGIDEKVFNEEQMKIIKEEVRGLNEKLKSKKSQPIDEFQKSLLSLRDQKMKEALSKIK
ncbi:MAG: hypothetical protein ACP5RT_00590 [Candidatus Micrarchaeia archaeon]